MAYRSTFVKSIQRGTITLNNVNSNTATVTSVDTNTSVLYCHGYTSAGTGTDKRTWLMSLVLTNATTITATVNLVEAVNHIISYELVEYYTGVIKSLQRGTVTVVAAASGTATITAVNTAKSHLVMGWHTNSDGTAQGNTLCGRLEFTNSTTVTFFSVGALGTWLVPFQVVEWY